MKISSAQLSALSSKLAREYQEITRTNNIETRKKHPQIQELVTKTLATYVAMSEIEKQMIDSRTFRIYEPTDIAILERKAAELLKIEFKNEYFSQDRIKEEILVASIDSATLTGIEKIVKKNLFK